MNSELEQMKKLFDVPTAGSWRQNTFWTMECTEIQVGRTGYRVHTYGAGRMLHVTIYPIHCSRVIRTAVNKMNADPYTSEAQKKLNWRHSKERLILVAETNFTESDTFITLTYAGALPDFERCQRDVANYVKCLRRYLTKIGKELKYIYTIAEDTEKRIHVHMIINGHLDIAVLQKKWKKHGNVDAEKLDKTDNALSGIAKYFYRQNERNSRNTDWAGKHMWQGSQNLEQPIERVSDCKVSKRQVKLLSTDVKSNGKEILGKLYEGYYLVGEPEVKTSQWFEDGVYIECILRSMSPDTHLSKKKAKKRRAQKPYLKTTTAKAVQQENKAPNSTPVPEILKEYPPQKRGRVVTVNKNFLFTYDHVHYSLPAQYRGKTVRVFPYEDHLDIYDGDDFIRSWSRSYGDPWQIECTDIPVGWNNYYYFSWADKIGPSTRRYIEALIMSRRYPVEAYRTAQGILKMAKDCNNTVFETCCKKALKKKAFSYKDFVKMLTICRDRWVDASLNKGHEPVRTEQINLFAFIDGTNIH